MSVTLRDAKRSDDDQLWIKSVYPEYLDELAEVSRSGTGVFPVLGEHGARHAELLARWFRDDRSHPLLILDGGRAAGFALVARPLAGTVTTDAVEYRMAEFFIRRSFRRRASSSAASRVAGRSSKRARTTAPCASGVASSWTTPVVTTTSACATARYASAFRAATRPASAAADFVALAAGAHLWRALAAAQRPARSPIPPQ
jgi:predicted acetyltransferase